MPYRNHPRDRRKPKKSSGVTPLYLSMVSGFRAQGFRVLRVKGLGFRV